MALVIQKGEVRQLGIEVTSTSADDLFIIDSASYKVFDIQDATRSNPLSEGVCQITDHKIILLFDALNKGQFTVEITYRILPEVLKADIIVSVR